MGPALLLSLLAIGAPPGIEAPPEPDHVVVGPSPGDPHGRADSWVTPPPALQAEQSPELIPPASGALFVPAMTDGGLEPECFIYRKGQSDQFTTARIGTKIIVPPGTWRVLVGSGSPEEMMEFEAEVIEDRVTFIPAEWAGLTVQVINERGTSFRGAYELIAMPEQAYVGLGLGAVKQEGERAKTWLLEPGLYMLLGAGESYQARRNFFTFRLEPGALTELTVVMNELTGDLLGAGEIPGGTEVGAGFNVSWTLGGDLELRNLRNVSGKADGTSFSGTVFTETEVHWTSQGHDGYGRLNLELGGSVDLPDRPFIPDVNEADLESSYTYFVVPWFGPSVLFGASTRLMPSILDFDERTDVVKLDRDEVVVDRDAGVLDVEVAEPFAPVNLEFGAGARINLDPTFWFNLTSFIGPGGRQLFARGLFDKEFDDPSTDAVELKQVGDATQFGIRATLVSQLNITRWVLLKLDADALAPFDNFAGTILDFRGTATLRLSTFASLNYTLRLIQDEKVTAETQIDQSLLLRFSFKIF